MFQVFHFESEVFLSTSENNGKKKGEGVSYIYMDF